MLLAKGDAVPYLCWKIKILYFSIKMVLHKQIPEYEFRIFKISFPVFVPVVLQQSADGRHGLQ